MQFLGATGDENGVRGPNLDDGMSHEMLYGGETGAVHTPVLVDVPTDGSWFTVDAGSVLAFREDDGLVGIVNSLMGEARTLAFLANGFSTPDILDSPRFSPDRGWLVASLADPSRAGTTLGFWQLGFDGPSLEISLETEHAGRGVRSVSPGGRQHSPRDTGGRCVAHPGAKLPDVSRLLN